MEDNLELEKKIEQAKDMIAAGIPISVVLKTFDLKAVDLGLIKY